MSLGSPRLSSSASASAYAFEFLSSSTQPSDSSSALVMTPGAGISLLPPTLDWPSSPSGLLPLLDNDSASSLSASSSISSSASVSPVVMTSWYANSAATAAAMAAAAAAAASAGLHSTSLPGTKRPRIAAHRPRASSTRETSESSEHEYDDDLEMGGSTGSGSGSDNPRSLSSSSSSSSASPDPELAQHRARNRAAASRYRERKQSQRNSLECSVHALKQQVECSQQQAASAAKENQFLRSQLAFLTNLLSAHLPSTLMMGGGDIKPHRSDSDSHHGFNFGFPGLPDATAREKGSSLLAVAFVFVLISLLPTAHVLGAYSMPSPSSSSFPSAVAGGVGHPNGFAPTSSAHLAMSSHTQQSSGGHHYHAGARALLSINDGDDESSATNSVMGASRGFEQPSSWSSWSLVVSVLARLLLVLSYASMACVLFVGASIALMNGSVRALANRVGGAVRTLRARIASARGVCPKRQKSMA